MANKKRRNEIQQAHQRKIQGQKYDAAVKKIRIFPIIAIGISVLVLALLFVTFANIYNSAVGVEVKVSGWSFAIAGLTGKFTSPDAVYGDLAHPFYTFAAKWCESIATLTLVAAILVLVMIIVAVVSIIRQNYALNLISAVLSLAVFVLLIVCYVKGVDMVHSDIIPIYCSGNPLCSIQSYAIFPALFALGVVPVSIIAAIKYFIARKLLK